MSHLSTFVLFSLKIVLAKLNYWSCVLIHFIREQKTTLQSKIGHCKKNTPLKATDYRKSATNKGVFWKFKLMVTKFRLKL